jgi:hypothetical protein
MMWSTHSRRIDPISRSATPFCQGEAGAVGSSRIAAYDATRTRGVRKCITEQESYDIGWFEFLEVVAVDKCKLRGTEALKSYRGEDGDNTDLLNGAVSWAEFNDSTKPEDVPFYRGQNDARIIYDSRPMKRMCDDLIRRFGPQGTKFPGLVGQ